MLNFAIKSKVANNSSHWNILVFCDHWKMVSDLNISHGKMSDFVSFLLLRYTLVIQLRNVKLEFHWNTLIKKEMATDLDMHYGKIIDFISLPLCGLNLVIKLRNLGFGSNWRDFNIFWSKADFRFEYFWSNSVWFGLSFVVWVELWQ